MATSVEGRSVNYGVIGTGLHVRSVLFVLFCISGVFATNSKQYSGTPILNNNGLQYKE